MSDLELNFIHTLSSKPTWYLVFFFNFNAIKTFELKI